MQNGRGHGQVSLAVGLVNLALIALAVFTTVPFAGMIWSLAALATAFALVTGLLVWMKRPLRPHARPV